MKIGMHLTEFILLLFMLLLTIGCDSSKSMTESHEVCIHFDERQCGTDTFASRFEPGAALSDRLTEIRKYLKEKGVAVLDMKVVPDFHEAVCEACDICPELHRYFVKTDSPGFRVLGELKLLNFGAFNCRNW